MGNAAMQATVSGLGVIGTLSGYAQYERTRKGPTCPPTSRLKDLEKIS